MEQLVVNVELACGLPSQSSAPQRYRVSVEQEQVS